MKAILYSDQLSHGLGIVYRAVSTRIILPILANVLMECDGKEMVLSATNLEIGIKTVVPVESCGVFTTTVPAKLLMDLCVTLSGKIDLAFIEGNQTLSITSESSKHSIRCIAPNDFPPIPNFPVDYFQIPSSVFRTVVQRTCISALAPTVEQGVAITGVMLHSANRQLKMVALDRFRMSRSVLEVDSGSIGDFSLLIPAVSLLEVAKLISSETVLISYDNEKVQFKVGGVEVFIGLLGSITQFPNFELFPAANGTTIFTIKTNEILGATKQTSIFTDEKNLILLSIGAMYAELSAGAQLGDGKSTIVGTIVGAPMNVKMNANYLLDILNVINAEEIVFMLSGDKSPIFIKAVGDHSFDHMIMPFS